MTDYARRGDRPPWSWHGVVAVILATCVGGGWLVGVTLAALETVDDTGLDQSLASLLNGIGQVLAGALGTYLGFAAGAKTAPAAPGRDTPGTAAVPDSGVGDR